MAAGGSFQENFLEGPLAAMHARLRHLLRAGARCGEFRQVAASDVYRVLKAALLIRLVFPDDASLLRRPNAAEIRATQRWLWDIARSHLSPRSKLARRRPQPGAVARSRRRRMG
jgi:hypothetical protein